MGSDEKKGAKTSMAALFPYVAETLTGLLTSQISDLDITVGCFESNSISAAVQLVHGVDFLLILSPVFDSFEVEWISKSSRVAPFIAKFDCGIDSCFGVGRN